MTSAISIDGAWVCAEGAAQKGTVLIEGRRIKAVAYAEEDRAQLRAHAGQRVDGTGHWLLPGLIDGHAHSYSGVLRGTENSLPLELWALYTTVYGRAIDATGIRLAILLGAAERIRAGITGLVDHSPMVHFGAEAIAAHEASGLRVAFAAFLHDRSDYDLLDIELPPSIAPLVSGPSGPGCGGVCTQFRRVGGGGAEWIWPGERAIGAECAAALFASGLAALAYTARPA